MARLLGLSCLLATMLLFFSSAGADDDTKKPKKNDIEELFTLLDVNMDGKLTRDEFLKMADRAKDKDKARENLGKTYDKLDPQKKGITKLKFKEFMDTKKK